MSDPGVRFHMIYPDDLPDVEWADLLRDRTRRRMQRYAEMRRAVGRERFDEWIDKRVERRHAAAQESAPPKLTYFEPRPAIMTPHVMLKRRAYYAMLNVAPTGGGKRKTYTSRACASIREALQSFYTLHPDVADILREKLRAKGYDEQGAPL